MTNGNKKKKNQLGMPYGTASAKLKKAIFFELIKKLNLNNCFHCGKDILNIEELSVEHKVPWLDSENPVSFFFDLNNIGFSHLKCNCGNNRNAKTGTGKHPSYYSYKCGCRCDGCCDFNTKYKAKMRLKIKKARIAQLAEH